MDDQPEVIRQQMEETRASLTEKLETLEHQVVDTVQDATTAVAETVECVKTAVQDTVETMKDSVQDGVESVKDVFDIQRQVDRHPWAMLGASVAVGYLGGRLLNGGGSDQGRIERLNGATSSEIPWPPGRKNGHAHAHALQDESSARIVPVRSSAASAESGWLHELTDKFEPEIKQLKGLAVGTLLSLLRDVIAGSAPVELKPQLADVMDSINRKLGGKPLQNRILSEKASVC
jgi:ElaB/YqjD/DUF883 family membrane-anchored ribosome-binding protein